MYRKITAILLLAGILIGTWLTPLTGLSEGNAEMIYVVGCLSNLSDQTSLEIYVTGGDIYMRCEDAAALSGYTLLQADDSGAWFGRNGDQVYQNNAVSYNGSVWVQINETMDKLTTKVTQEESLLAFSARVHTRQDLFNLTDAYMETGQYNLSENSNILLTITKELATLYNRLEGLQFFETLSGVYDIRKYNQVFNLIIDSTGSSDIIDLFSGADTIAKNLKTLQDFQFGKLSSDELMDLYRQGQIGNAGMVISVYKDITDPISYFLKNVLHSDKVIGGLDLSTQLDLFQNINAIRSCDDIYKNMVSYTYSDADYRKAIQVADLNLWEKMAGAFGTFPDRYLPSRAQLAVEEIKRLAMSGDSLKLLGEVILQEASTVGINSLLKIAKEDNPYSILVSVQKLFNKYYFTDAVDTIDYMESYKYLARLQMGLPELYRRYKNCSDTAVNAKYCTLLYMRICQTAYEESVKKGLVDANAHNLGNQISNEMKQIIAISDSDLMAFEKNSRIDVQKLISKASIPALLDDSISPVTPVETAAPVTPTPAPLPDDGLSSWWFGSYEDLTDYVEEMDLRYGRADNRLSTEMPSGITLGYEMNDWIDVFHDSSNYFNLYCDIIVMGYGNYDFTDKHLSLIESDLLGWGQADGTPEIRDEYYLFEITGDGTMDKICVRMTNKDGVEVEARLYETQSYVDATPTPAAEEEDIYADITPTPIFEEGEFYADSLFAMVHGLSDAEYRARVGAYDTALGRTTRAYGHIDDFDIGYCGMLQGEANDAQSLLFNLLNCPWYVPESSGIEQLLYGTYYVSLWQTEIYGWGNDARHDEYYRFGILTRGDEQYEIYDVIFNIGQASNSEHWAEGRIINVSTETIIDVEDPPIVYEVLKPGELFYKWNEYAQYNLWGADSVSVCDISWHDQDTPMTNYEYSFSNGVSVGYVGSFFGRNAQNAKEWFIQLAEEERWRNSDQVVSYYLAEQLTDIDTVEVTGSELYGWTMGQSSDGYDMLSEEELYEVVVTLNSTGIMYEIMFEMTSSYDDGEGLQSLLVGSMEVDGWEPPEEDNGDSAIYDRGLVNAPLNEAEEMFFNKYPYDEWTLLGDLVYGDTSGWTVATLFSTVGGIMCVVDNVNEYVNIYAEADTGTQSLQRAYLGSGVLVLGFWQDWALCLCEDYQENNPVCGWVRSKYLVSEEVYAELHTGEREDNWDDVYIDNETPVVDDERQGEYLGILTVVNCDEWVSLRDGPNGDADRVAKVPLWASVEAWYWDSEWVQCQYDGMWGFIRTDYLTDWPEKYDGYLDLFG